MCFIHTPRSGLYSILHIFSGGWSERGVRCESEGMRGHVFHSQASKLDCALYYTYSLEKGARGGPGVRVRG